MPPSSSSVLPLLNRLSGSVSCTVRRFCAIIPAHAELYEGESTKAFARASDEISEDRLRVRVCVPQFYAIYFLMNEGQRRAVITRDFIHKIKKK